MKNKEVIKQIIYILLTSILILIVFPNNPITNFGKYCRDQVESFFKK